MNGPLGKVTEPVQTPEYLALSQKEQDALIDEVLFPPSSKSLLQLSRLPEAPSFLKTPVYQKLLEKSDSIFSAD